MKKIFLSNGQVSLVSDEDFLYLVGYNWWLQSAGYVEAYINSKHQLMHRIVVERIGLDLSKGEVDHFDGNILNNQRENLRIATRSQNKMNTHYPITNTSGYKGVTWCKRNQKWKAQIKINGRNYNLGYFDNPEEAHEAYCKAAEKYFGKFARTE